jgi:acetyl esterase/lipase
VYTTRGGSPVKLDVYLPRGTAPGGGWPVVLAIHGGGWRKFSKEGYGRDMARALTAEGFAVVAPNYALAAPGRPTWPLNFQQLQDAVRWVRAQAPAFGFDPGRVAAMGESAGGHLAALLGTYPDAAGLPPARVDAVVDFYGPVDLPRLPTDSPTADIAARQFLGTTFDADPARYRAASPVQWVDPHSAPMLILQGTADRLVPVSQSESLADALGRAGVARQLVIVPGGLHGFRFASGGMNLLPTVVGFLNTHLKGR